MLSNPRLDLVTSKVPLKYMVVDEASQIAVSDYIAPLETFKTLQKICFIGDDKQCELLIPLISETSLIYLSSATLWTG